MSFRLALAGLAATLVAAPLVWAQTDPIAFELSNQTDRTLTRLSISLPSAGVWERDVLDAAVVRPGQSVRVSIENGLDECVYDVRADFRDGAPIEIARVDFCDLDGSELVIE